MSELRHEHRVVGFVNAYSSTGTSSGATVDRDELIARTRTHPRGSRAAEIVVIRSEPPRTGTGKLLRRKVPADPTKTTPKVEA